ncbi:hypothetical protein [Fibrella aestuarina]|uniref:hypothetical protein n=1 Tax=Fibrella aestuarina TaxID=651143 RepID=UPI00059BA2F3|nr:hypothetical protein [Fibrella aestuarina]
MSYTEIFAFKKTGEIESIAEIRNSHRGAAAVWSTVEDRYLPKKQYSRIVLSEMQDIWDLWKRDDVSLTDKIVLLSTFDHVIVEKEHIPRLIAAFRAFVGQTSLPEQADAIAKIQDDPDLWAIGWNQTSINSDDWTNLGGYDEETDEPIPYDFKTGELHWRLFSFEEKPTKDQ